jgi:hypothetical protein
MLEECNVVFSSQRHFPLARPHCSRFVSARWAHLVHQFAATRVRGMTTTAQAKWRALIAAQERSGQSVREFALARGLAAGTLYW